jgi:hypothetical protein
MLDMMIMVIFSMNISNHPEPSRVSLFSHQNFPPMAMPTPTNPKGMSQK